MANVNQRYKYLLVAGILLTGVFAWVLIQKETSNQHEPAELNQSPQNSVGVGNSDLSNIIDDQDLSDVNHFSREEEPASSQAGTESKDTVDDEDKPLDSVLDYGRTRPISEDLNSQVASVAEALATDAYPERLSALIQPQEFDRFAYLQNPQDYLDTVEPGRVFQSAQPEESPRIQRLSPSYVQLKQGERTPLKVRVEPNMPVTFTSFDLGAFENQLTSITVQANQSGVAETSFIAASGTIADVNILAASPTTSGRVKFIVNIQTP